MDSQQGEGQQWHAVDQHSSHLEAPFPHSSQPQEQQPQQPQSDAAANGGEGPKEGSKRRKKKAWGAVDQSTAAALTVLQQQQLEQEGSQEQGTALGSDGEPAPKKQRRSRWEAQAPQSALICSSGLPITLPQSLAHLIDINPECLELNRQLNLVR